MSEKVPLENLSKIVNSKDSFPNPKKKTEFLQLLQEFILAKFSTLRELEIAAESNPNQPELKAKLKAAQEALSQDFISRFERLIVIAGLTGEIIKKLDEAKEEIALELERVGTDSKLRLLFTLTLMRAFASDLAPHRDLNRTTQTMSRLDLVK